MGRSKNRKLFIPESHSYKEIKIRAHDQGDRQLHLGMQLLLHLCLIWLKLGIFYLTVKLIPKNAVYLFSSSREGTFIELALSRELLFHFGVMHSLLYL